MTTKTSAETQLAIDTIRTLSMDGVQKANSGHPGTPMALAPLAYTLWKNHIRFDPNVPEWADRDRFILSAGHASMLLYSMLHLTGYDLSLDDLKNFRQWDSPTAGHPERGMVPGIEVTTGPLGQGISNAVGVAMAEQMLAARFNRPGHTVVDHHTYVIAGDGDLMEGVSYEACSLAGHQKLGKLICFYDDNQISIAGSTSLTFTEDPMKRFEAAGWQTIRVADINDLDALETAIHEAKAETTKPSLIITRSVIGYGSPNRSGKKEAHGEPLGADEVRLTKEAYGWPVGETFYVPEETRELFREAIDRGKSSHRQWEGVFEAYKSGHPTEAAEFERVMATKLPKDWSAVCTSLEVPDKPEATRASSGRAVQAIAEVVPELVGGSADLDPSTKTFIKSSVNFDVDHRDGRNIQYGVREHGMGAIANGLAAHGGIRPFCATFFVFSDYMRPTIRMAAISHLPTIFVYTHDSIGLGEDGPTHQPIEHLASLRAMPNVHVMRPADSRETAEAWMAAMERTQGPTVLVFSRQNLPQMNRTDSGLGSADGARLGGYVLREVEGEPDLTLIATGSEIAQAMEAADQLAGDGKKVRVVSLPCWEAFDDQDPQYRKSVLGPDSSPRLSIEAGASMGWERYVGPNGASIGIDRFGASAPGEVNLQKFGFTTDQILAKARTLM